MTLHLSDINKRLGKGTTSLDLQFLNLLRPNFSSGSWLMRRLKSEKGFLRNRRISKHDVSCIEKLTWPFLIYSPGPLTYKLQLETKHLLNYVRGESKYCKFTYKWPFLLVLSSLRFAIVHAAFALRKKQNDRHNTVGILIFNTLFSNCSEFTFSLYCHFADPSVTNL